MRQPLTSGVPPVAAGRHGVGVFANEGHEHAVGAAAEVSSGRVRSFG
jgi:hypothetical protein